MQSEGSLEATAASTNTGKHRCGLCLKIFNTIQALCGHQNAHRNDPRKRKPTHECVPNKRPTPRALPPPPPPHPTPPPPQAIPWHNYQHFGQAIQSEASRVGLDLNAMPSEGGGGGGLDLNAMPRECGGGGLDLNAMPRECGGGGGGGEDVDLELKL